MIEDITKRPSGKAMVSRSGSYDRLWRILTRKRSSELINLQNHFNRSNSSQAGVDRHNEGLNLPGGTA
jgi:hypothetical protein